MTKYFFLGVALASFSMGAVAIGFFPDLGWRVLAVSAAASLLVMACEAVELK